MTQRRVIHTLQDVFFHSSGNRVVLHKGYHGYVESNVIIHEWITRLIQSSHQEYCLLFPYHFLVKSIHMLALDICCVGS